MSIFNLFDSKEDITQSVEKLLATLKIERTLSFHDFKVLLEQCHFLLEMDSSNPNSYNLCLSVICHSSEYLPNTDFLRQLLFECIQSSRVFLYNQMIERRSQSYSESIQYGIFNELSQSYYTLDSDTILTKEQKVLFDTFNQKKRIVVSAPTSFGKSRIVQEIILHNGYKNVILVLPTVALLNETFHKFKENKEFNEYKIANSINNISFGDRNILILTPEKTDLFLDQNPDFNISFFVMDEIYKIQDDPGRKNIFTHCLYRLSKHKADFYLIGPYFKKFSQVFLERNNASFIKFTGEIVQKDVFELDDVKEGDTYSINGRTFKKLKTKDRNLLNIVSALQEQTLIYIGRRDSVETRAKLLSDKRPFSAQMELIDYIKDNIADKWSLISCLEKGVAFHHSAIPKYIQSEIIELFNNGTIEVIVCTSTLTEGVNTTAKNVIIFDNFKGREEIKLTGFDVKNIKGRAGRFYVHFIGRVYGLEPLHSESDKDNVEFSYFDNKGLESEEVIQIDKIELTDQNLNLRINIENLLKEKSIPLSLIRSNKFISIQNQILLIEYLRKNRTVLRKVFFSGNLPTADQLDMIINLCFDFLFNNQDREDQKFGLLGLSRQTKFYLYKDPSIKLLIRNQNGVKDDTKIRNAFSLISHYFEFALPKYFTAFENIYNFVYREVFLKSIGISLKYLITKLEFGFVENHEIALKDAGLPNDIIRKVSKSFKDCATIEAIRLKLKINPYLLNPLSPFERKVFHRYI